MKPKLTAKARTARLITILCAVSASLSMIYCRSYPEPDEMQEYYFYGQQTQLHGLARVPPRAVDKDKPAVTSLSERRAVCKEEAVRDAQARFLALTLRPPLDAAEWHRRLNMGARGDWSACFDNARIRNLFFEFPDYCRVVMVIPCNPGDY